ncbi:Protein of uncharacterised function (DUF1140) [Staphylococcus gallinarum]|uniref:Protein of uncharacterized function (DUF1140) n=1 Tax=Staphylococcus gallinarum TaxID=1293 RepID=A0A380FIJ0_STAGA|nr:Protein of uncharacterised function (DUF1140) [Staphylococcus gallinarum]
MDAEQLLTIHADVVVKKLLQLADKSYKSFLKASNTSYNAEVGTSRYWQSVASMELAQFEFSDYMKQLKFMDEYTQWSQKLHQDRYSLLRSMTL